MDRGSIQLSKRLQAVSALVPDCECVADVGCDHGYTSIFLVQQQKARRAIAMDVREGPLRKAQEHIQRQQLASYIQVRLSDGLKQLKPGEADVIVIAGMGGATMSGILRRGRHLLTKQVTLVLQPQSELMEFRRFLAEEGFVVTAEDLVLEDGKYYPMMQAHMERGEWEADGQNVHEGAAGDTDVRYPVQEEELMFGPLLLRQRHPVLHQYLLWRQEQVQQILLQIEKHAAQEVRQKRTAELTGELMLIGRGLQRFQ